MLDMERGRGPDPFPSECDTEWRHGSRMFNYTQEEANLPVSL